MTVREPKVYYSYSQIANKHSVPDETPPAMSTRDQKGSGFALPELEHNLQLLIDLTEQDILQVRGKSEILSNHFQLLTRFKWASRFNFFLLLSLFILL